MSEHRVPNLIAGERVHGDQPLEVTHPYDDSPAGTTTYATPDQVERAVAHAAGLAGEGARLPVHARADALTAISEAIKANADELAELITAENGKPMMWSRAEVGRAVSVFRWAAEETRQQGGEVMRLDTDAAAEGRLAYVRHVPIGPVLAISPFNFPLNLVAHKVAPAIAVGAPVVLKPAPKTPLSGLRLGELIAETDLPPGFVQVLNVKNEEAGSLVDDPRLPVVSFTGSGPVGYAIRDQVPGKHVVLELGGNAAVYVASDYASEADLDWASTRIANFSNYQAGQSCIGVQRVFADASLYEDLKARVVEKVAALVTGDPRDEKTFVGPMIEEAAAERVEQWVTAAQGLGASVLTGGHRDFTTYAPTVLEGVPHEAKASCEEVFGPVLLLESVEGDEAGLAAINDSKFGLQAGVFTHDLQLAFRAQRELEVGGVIIGDAPSYRADQMPYGGVKDSGVGREGIRYTMTDFTYERVMVLTGLDL
ncbi:aldehyde dehydrogenase family protein [Nocardioides mangrovicus]|uniref:Aldehyde dehydrogenase family protein n=1 Tax=Nocardioides mangrovicus TaxID=2478913 RepID=A0A3L8P0A3_9ACTN|nr:aldehyde dehydrogenase family protein [Nocardioides mangrovicus]RLV48870.1 aldehyde dehydrogenase family protein [Nocardioides mangrovicus]